MGEESAKAASGRQDAGGKSPHDEARCWPGRRASRGGVQGDPFDDEIRWGERRKGIFESVKKDYAAGHKQMGSHEHEEAMLMLVGEAASA